MSSTNTKQKPTHRIYQVTGEGADAVWTPIAAAWAHKDGKGFNILANPIILGKIVMREITSNNAHDSEGGAA